jgi:hypothetical protein
MSKTLTMFTPKTLTTARIKAEHDLAMITVGGHRMERACRVALNDHGTCSAEAIEIALRFICDELGLRDAKALMDTIVTDQAPTSE